MNYSVAQRTSEIGIRAALGARPLYLVALILRDLLIPSGAGLAAGLGCSAALMSYVRSLLFGVRPIDPAVVITGAAVFLFIAMIAGGLPAYRAATIDPMTALRHA